MDIMKAEGTPVRVTDLLVSGNVRIIDNVTNRVLFDTARDGGDCPPTVAIRYVGWMKIERDYLTIQTSLLPYDDKTMDAIRTFAHNQWNKGAYVVSIESDTTDQLVNNPWVESSGRFELSSDRDAIDYWGSDVFYLFCMDAYAYLKGSGEL